MWLLTSLLASDGYAGPSATGDASTDAEPGEYRRLSEELDALASKSAWVGVERTFQQLLTTGVTPTFEQWVRGAEAARAMGDVTAVRERLIAANAAREDRQVLDWLWEIDRNYGLVSLQCDPGSHILLVPTLLVLDPDVRRAVELASQQIHDFCRFSGLLPAGSYSFHESTFEVTPMRPALTIDLRGIKLDKNTRRELKEAWSQTP